MATTKITTKHQIIKKWSNKYLGYPQVIDSPSASADTPGLRIGFTDEIDNTLHKRKIRYVDWEEFFERFEDEHLAFIYIDEVDGYDPRHLHKAYCFIKRDSLQIIIEKERNKLLEEFMKEFISQNREPNVL